LQGEELMQELGRHVYLTVLHISWPKLAYQIGDVVVTVAQDGKEQEIAEEFRNNPQWNLMPQQWHDIFTTIEGRARRLLASTSVQFATRGMALLPIMRAPEIFGELRQLRADMYENRDRFVARYGDFLDQLHTQLGDSLFKLARKKLPAKADVHDKFGMVWAIMPIGGGRILATATELEGLEASLQHAIASMLGEERMIPADLAPALALTQRMLRTARNPIEALGDDTAVELINEARRQMHQITENMIEEMAREPRQALIDAANNLLSKITDGRARDGSLNQCRRAFDLLHSFSFLADDELLQRIRQCELALDGVTARDVNVDPGIGNQLANTLRHVIAQASNPAALETSVRQFRRIYTGADSV
jgi:hypothetical protein